MSAQANYIWNWFQNILEFSKYYMHLFFRTNKKIIQTKSSLPFDWLYDKNDELFNESKLKIKYTYLNGINVHN